jgi:hypothetical protein
MRAAIRKAVNLDPAQRLGAAALVSTRPCYRLRAASRAASRTRSSLKETAVRVEPNYCVQRQPDDPASAAS